jgi:hypothetical protein
MYLTATIDGVSYQLQIESDTEIKIVGWLPTFFFILYVFIFDYDTVDIWSQLRRWVPHFW